MLVAASFAFSEADADLFKQVRTKQACPIFKIGTDDQQHAVSAKPATLKKTGMLLCM